MRNLLEELDSQTFILDSPVEISAIPIFNFEDVSVCKVDSKCIEVTIAAGRNVNEVFSELDRLGIEISSMRNKTNRLEQLFMSRLNENGLK